MNKIFILLILLISVKCSSPKKITSFIDAAPVYKYTDSKNWDYFEVTSYGTKSMEQLSENAKSKLLTKLIKEGFTGLIEIKPLVPNPERQEKLLNQEFNKIIEVSKDSNCILVDYRRKIRPIFMSKRKQYTKTFTISLNIVNIKQKLNQ